VTEVVAGGVTLFSDVSATRQRRNVSSVLSKRRGDVTLNVTEIAIGDDVCVVTLEVLLLVHKLLGIYVGRCIIYKLLLNLGTWVCICILMSVSLRYIRGIAMYTYVHGYVDTFLGI
jgi:hypothetical protein